MPSILAILLAVSLLDAGGDQLAPPPGDGEIRAVYSDLLRQTQIWLTLELKAAGGRPPSPVLLTIGRTFSGRVPLGPPALFAVRASLTSPGEPRAELWLVADGGRVDLAAGNPQALRTGDEDALTTAIPAETLKRIAGAERITGNALGFAFELTASQREALRAFVARAMSADPAAATPRAARRSDRRAPRAARAGRRQSARR